MSPHWALSSPVQPRSWRRGLRAEAWDTPQGCALVPGYPRRAPAGSGTHRGLSLRGGRPSPPRQAQRPWWAPARGHPQPPSPTCGSDRSRADVRTAEPGRQPSWTSAAQSTCQRRSRFQKFNFFSVYYIYFFPKVTQPSLQHHCGEFTHCPKKKKKKRNTKKKENETK